MKCKRSILAPVPLVLILSVLSGCSSHHREPLRVSKTNPRYFDDGSGKAVYLTGSHTWNNLVEMTPAGNPDTFDYPAYLDFLERYDHNFIRLWAWELVNWDTRGNVQELPKVLEVNPHPWKRTGPEMHWMANPNLILPNLMKLTSSACDTG